MKNLTVDCGTFELSMGETKVMSGTSFQEWYSDVFIPDMSDEPRYRGSELPGKAFLVTVHAKNLSATESLELPVRTPCALAYADGRSARPCRTSCLKVAASSGKTLTARTGRRPPPKVRMDAGSRRTIQQGSMPMT
ncbi:MAG: hypothetical protein RSN88_07445, partial [Gordonibacter sp.]|uniref:hypothetical protein n=1 Tax=Gordonibacter sp. TaxID=1968902 RepID=UPI002FCBB9F6